jgi:hypothetical protein
MSLAFFRNWLKREKEALEVYQTTRQQQQQAVFHPAQSRSAVSIPIPTSTQVTIPRLPSLMHLDDEDDLIRKKMLTRCS